MTERFSQEPPQVIVIENLLASPKFRPANGNALPTLVGFDLQGITTHTRAALVRAADLREQGLDVNVHVWLDDSTRGLVFVDPNSGAVHRGFSPEEAKNQGYVRVPMTRGRLIDPSLIVRGTAVTRGGAEKIARAPALNELHPDLRRPIEALLAETGEASKGFVTVLEANAVNYAKTVAGSRRKADGCEYDVDAQGVPKVVCGIPGLKQERGLNCEEVLAAFMMLSAGFQFDMVRHARNPRLDASGQLAPVGIELWTTPAGGADRLDQFAAVRDVIPRLWNIPNADRFVTLVQG